MEGMEHENIPVVWFRGGLARASSPCVSGVEEEACRAEADKELCSPRVLAGTHLLETRQGGSLVWPALTAFVFSDNLVYTHPEDRLPAVVTSFKYHICLGSDTT